MSYIASGSGHVIFSNPSKSTNKQACDLLSQEFEYILGFCRSNPNQIDFWTDRNYHEDSVKDILNDLADLSPIQEGELCYEGEDRSYWRFIFKDGKWIEQIGQIVYS